MEKENRMRRRQGLEKRQKRGGEKKEKKEKRKRRKKKSRERNRRNRSFLCISSLLLVVSEGQKSREFVDTVNIEQPHMIQKKTENGK